TLRYTKYEAKKRKNLNPTLEWSWFVSSIATNKLLKFRRRRLHPSQVLVIPKSRQWKALTTVKSYLDEKTPQEGDVGSTNRNTDQVMSLTPIDYSLGESLHLEYTCRFLRMVFYGLVNLLLKFGSIIFHFQPLSNFN